MIFHQLSIWLIWGSLVLGLLTIIIVGSQSREDARSVAIWTLTILVPMLLVTCAIIAVSGGPGGLNGGAGMITICCTLIVAVGLGYRIATSRHTVSQAKKVEPGLSDDELA